MSKNRIVDNTIHNPSVANSRHLALVGGLHGAALAVLLAMFGGKLLSLSIDVALHFAVVDEIMKHGRLRSGALNLGIMALYPPLSHWAAATIGWVSGSGFAALCLITVASTYVCYYALSRIAAIGSGFAALPIFIIIFILLASTRSQIGWEIVGNFFYPQIVASALYISAILWLAVERTEPPQTALFAALVGPVVYMTQPIAGLHLIGAVALFLVSEAICLVLIERPINIARIAMVFAAAFGTAAVSVIILWMVPGIVTISAHEGTLEFDFPHNAILLPFIFCVAASVANLVSGLRCWPDGRVDRLVGAAGVAAGVLMLLQFLVLTTFGSGSFYAVKKHGFLIVTLGALNLARLLARQVPIGEIPTGWQPPAAITVAFFATTVVFGIPGMPIEPFIAAQRFAEHYAETSPYFTPGNTSVSARSVPPIIKFMTTISTFGMPLDRALPTIGAIDLDAAYQMIDRPAAEMSCAVAGNNTFSVVSTSCLTRLEEATQVEFRLGGSGSRYLNAQWLSQENWGVWGGERSTLAIQLPKKDYKITAQVRGVVAPSHPQRAFTVSVNGHQVAIWTFTMSSSTGERTAFLPAAFIPESGVTEIAFSSTSPLVSPQEIGINADPRLLGLGLTSMVIK
jgi:hypothetical protein